MTNDMINLNRKPGEQHFLVYKKVYVRAGLDNDTVVSYYFTRYRRVGVMSVFYS